MKKLSSSLVYIFCLLFFLYALAFMFDWNARMNMESVGAAIWSSRIALVLDVLCLLVVTNHFRDRIRGIHLVCLLWVLIMPLIMYHNHSSLGVSVLTILWPFLFEMTYICCCSRVYVLTIRSVFLAVFLAGLAFYLPTRLDIFKQTNTIYFCFLTLPWLLLNRNRRTVLLLLMVFSFLALVSLKRSVIVCTVFIWLFYCMERIKGRKSIIALVLSFSVLLFAVTFLYNVVDERLHGKLTERVTREETYEGHDRLAIWELTINMIQNSSNEKLVLGHGYAGVRNNSFLDISAHNDFLEIVYDYGLIIFALYLGLWVHIVRRCILLFKMKSSLFLPYSVSLSIMLVMSMVSQLLPYATYFNYLVMFWGMTEAIIKTGKDISFKCQ